MRSVTVRAPGKVNLQLAVGGVREDGYHELVSIFHAVSASDDITVTPRGVGFEGEGFVIEVDAKPELRLHGLKGATAAALAEVPRDSGNLAYQAMLALEDFVGEELDAHISISKGIPVAGGMAGGSADAAGTLLAADHAFSLGLSREELTGIAATLGSDVPFALYGGTALGSGRGELITPVLVQGTYQWVFALCAQGLSTPAVYREFDNLARGRFLVDPAASPKLLQALRRGDAASVGASMHNDLQPAAISLRPELEHLLVIGEDAGAYASIVSGSGPTCAFLVPDSEVAEDLVTLFAASEDCVGTLRAEGPAHGARVVEV